MTKLLLTMGLFCVSAQISGQILDSFQYTGLPKSERWSGDRSSFRVDQGYLYSNHTQANSHFYISHPAWTDLEEGYLDIKLDIKTSSKNFIDVFLCADSADLSASTNALSIRIGDTKDEIRIEEQKGGSRSVLRNAWPGTTEFFQSRLHWSLEEDSLWLLNAGGKELRFNSDVCGQKRNYTGILIRQSTASFFGKHRFSEFYWGKRIPDLVLPFITEVRILSSKTLEVHFSEKWIL